MADNIAVTPGSGATVAADDIGGILYQRVKLTIGADGSATDVSTASPMPVSDAGGSLTVDGTVGISGSVAVTGTFYQATQPVTIATLPTLAAGTNNIGDVDVASIAAGETHIGQVGAPGDLVTVTPTLDTSAYASGDTLFDSTTVTGAVRVSGGRAILQSLTVIDVDDQGAGFDLFIFDASVTFGTINAAPSVSDSDAAKCLGWVSVTTADYIDVGGAKIACVRGLGLELKPTTATTVYVAAITRGTPTHTASGLKLRLGLLMD